MGRYTRCDLCQGATVIGLLKIGLLNFGLLPYANEAWRQFFKFRKI